MNEESGNVLNESGNILQESGNILQESENILEESLKWKEFEEIVLNIFRELQNGCKEQQQICKSLENKVAHLCQSKSDTALAINLEMFNKFTTTNNIVKLGKLSNKVNDSCNDVKMLLEKVSGLEQKHKENFANFQTKLTEKRINNKDTIKLQKAEIAAYEENAEKCASEASVKEEKEFLEINNLKDVQEEVSNALQTFLDAKEKLENEHNKINEKIQIVQKDQVQIDIEINQRKQFKESILADINKNTINTDQELNKINQTLINIKEKFDDTHLSTAETKKAIEEYGCAIEQFSKQNLLLNYNIECTGDRILQLENLKIQQNDEYLQNVLLLKNDIKLANGNLQQQEKILLNEKEIQKRDTSNMELIESDLHKERVKINAFQQNIDRLKEEKIGLIDLNNRERQSADMLSQEVLKKTNCIKNLKVNNDDVETKMLNFSTTHKNIIEKLTEKLETTKAYIDGKKTEIEMVKSKYKTEHSNREFELMSHFNAQKLKLENEILNIKKKNELDSEEIKQLSTVLETKTLECDILSTKIKTANELEESIKKEITYTLTKSGSKQKRQRDDTSDTSFDDDIPFYERVLMKRKKLKKTSSMRRN